MITEAAANERLPAFEIRRVRLSELARSITFLSQGCLTVEVVEYVRTEPGDMSETGNTWRIGTPIAGEVLPPKIRAVAAPHLFLQRDGVESILKAVIRIESEKIITTREINAAAKDTGLKKQTFFSYDPRTSILPLPDQKVFVLIGSENGVAGIESFIQSSEQACVVLAKQAGSEK